MENHEPQDSVQGLLGQLRRFAAERDWQQFHTPKNLASALIVEAAELLEPFQWLASGEKQELSEEQYQSVRMELADVFCYLLMMADRLDVDLIRATGEKIQLNARKYPMEKVKGSSLKYHEYLQKEDGAK